MSQILKFGLKTTPEKKGSNFSVYRRRISFLLFSECKSSLELSTFASEYCSKFIGITTAYFGSSRAVAEALMRHHVYIYALVPMRGDFG